MDFDIAYSDNQYSNFILPIHLRNVRRQKKEGEKNVKEASELRAKADRLIAEAKVAQEEAKRAAEEADRLAKEEADRVAKEQAALEAQQKEAAAQAATLEVPKKAMNYLPFVIGGVVVLGLILLLRKKE